MDKTGEKVKVRKKPKARKGRKEKGNEVKMDKEQKRSNKMRKISF
jgi:hypothetical protein